MTEWDDYATFKEKVEELVIGLRAAAMLHHVGRYPMLPVETFGYDLSQGRKYLRIYRENGVQRFVECFIDRETGDVFKPEGWKKPAKGVRGNINTAEGRRALAQSKIDNPYGYLYA